jgi:multimeric flavodoxin WrbA
MNVVAFNGSVRKDGNTDWLIRRCFFELEQEGIKTELIDLGSKPYLGCQACYKCFANKDHRCAVVDDDMNDYIAKMVEADGIILASPTYFADVSVGMKALIERAGMVARANNNHLRRKVGAAIVAVRRAGGLHVFDTINHFFLIGEMVVVGSSYWSLAKGRTPGEVSEDEEGVQTITTLGHNMAWLLKKLSV